MTAIQKSGIKLLVSITVFNLLSYSLSAQNQHLILSGLILDASTREGIPLVHVMDMKKGPGTNTDSTGRFRLDVTGFPILITFSHVAYFPDTLVIQNSREFGKNFSSDENLFFLRTNVFMIDEVMIPANTRKLFENEPFAIIEYQLAGNHVIAIGYRNYN